MHRPVCGIGPALTDTRENLIMNRKFIALTAAVAALALPAASLAQSATSGSSSTTAAANAGVR